MEATKPEEAAAAGKKELKGVGGWLAFLVFSMAVLSPVRTFFAYYRDVVVSEQRMNLSGNPSWEMFSTIVLALVLAGSALFILAAYRLCRQHVWRSVRFAIAAMWVACLGMDVIGLAVFYLVFGGEFLSVIWQGMTEPLLKGMVFPVVWTLYLLKSKRVRNTYRRETQMEEMARYLGMKGRQEEPGRGDWVEMGKREGKKG